jgi:bacterioferritin
LPGAVCLAERQSLFESLNEALAAELICALRRCTRRRSVPRSVDAPAVESQVPADFRLANQLAERIAQLGGHPEYALAVLDQTGLDQSDVLTPMNERILKDLTSEQAAASLHRKLLVRLGIGDSGTRLLVRELLRVNEEQVRSLSGLR